MDRERLVPVLRNVHNDLFQKVGVQRGAAPGLAVFLAKLGPTPHGTIGVTYLFQHHLPERIDVDSLFEQALINLRKGLRVQVIEKDGDQFRLIHRAEGLAASVIALPDFLENAAQWCDTKEMLVCIQDVNHAWVGALSSPMARDLQRKMHESVLTDAIDLDPACFILRESGFERLEPPLNSAAPAKQ
jgi:hypothetical protein